MLESLRAWRADAAARGVVPILTTLSQTEVKQLPPAQFSAVRAQLLRLEARGRHALQGLLGGQMVLRDMEGGAAEGLAWRIHAGGEGEAEQVITAVLRQVTDRGPGGRGGNGGRGMGRKESWG